MVNKNVSIEILGAGNLENYIEGNSSFYISTENKKLVFDFGFTTMHYLIKKKEMFNELDTIFLSHIHSDHIGGLEALGYNNIFTSKRKINLIAPQDVLLKVYDMLQNIYQYDKNIDVRDAFIFHSSNIFENDSMSISFLKTNHVDKMPAYGISVLDKKDKIKILISGDTIGYEKYIYEQHDIIIHDISMSKNNVHMHIIDLYNTIKFLGKDVYGYHYDFNTSIDFKNISKDIYEKYKIKLLKRGMII